MRAAVVKGVSGVWQYPVWCQPPVVQAAAHVPLTSTCVASWPRLKCSAARKPASMLSSALGDAGVRGHAIDTDC